MEDNPNNIEWTNEERPDLQEEPALVIPGPNQDAFKKSKKYFNDVPARLKDFNPY